MVIFLYGPDGYRLKQNAQIVLDSYKKKHRNGLNFLSIDLSELDAVNKLRSGIENLSFFDDIRLISVQNLFSVKNISNQVLEILRKNNINTNQKIVLLVSESEEEREIQSKNKDLFKLLSTKRNLVRSFEILKGKKLENWIQEEFSIRNCSADFATSRKLIDYVGSDSWSLANEIEKLCNYRQKGRITISDIDVLVSKKIDLNIFDLIEAIASKNKSKAFEILFKEMKTGRDPYYVLTMIIFQFRNLLMIHDLASSGLAANLISKKSGLHPFVVRKALYNLDKFKLNDLISCYGYLSDLDLGSKKGILNLEDSLFKFVLGAES